MKGYIQYYCYCRSFLLYLVVLGSKDHLSPVYLLQSFSLSLKPLCSLNSLSTSLRQNDELYLLDRNCRQICRLKISKLWLSLLSFLRNLWFRHQLIRHWELFFLAAHKLKELGEIGGLVGGLCPWWRNDLKPLLANFACLEVSSLLFVCVYADWKFQEVCREILTD